MDRPKVLITDDVHPVMLDEFNSRGWEVSFLPYITYEEVKKLIFSFEGLIINSKIKCDKEFLDLTSNLKFIGRLGSGREVVDLEYAVSKGIKVFFSPEGNKNAVAEHALGMLLALANQLIIADTQVRSKIWHREERRGWELSGKTIGIIGFGQTGSQFAKKLGSLEVNILVYDKYSSEFQNEFPLIQETSKEDLLSKSDIISLHLPLAKETFHYADKSFFESCKQGCILINTSRGNVVDTVAIIDALESGRMNGACLDVFENEKPERYSEEEKILYQRLFDLPQVVLSPHIAGWTHESKYKMATVLINKIFN